MRAGKRLGKYAGCMMSYPEVILGGRRLRCQDVELSRAARIRLESFQFYETHDRNARLTCRRFGISPETFYEWKGR
jgi:hypothetical protein